MTPKELVPAGKGSFEEPLTQGETHKMLGAMQGLNAALLEFRRTSMVELAIDPVIDVIRERDPEKRQELVDKISAHFGWS